MPPTGSFSHFALSSIAAVALPLVWARFRFKWAFKPAVAALFLVLSAGQMKEIVDLKRNHWSLPLAALREDSACDMAWNLAGGAAGSLLWGLASLAAAAPRRAREQGGFFPLPASREAGGDLESRREARLHLDPARGGRPSCGGLLRPPRPHPRLDPGHLQ